ncbi:twk-25, partial [Pristionchus pacificus]
FRFIMRDTPLPCEIAEAAEAHLSIAPGDPDENSSSRTPSSPSPIPSSMGKKRNRAMPELSVLDTKIDRIVEESSDDGRSEESENGDKKTTEEEGTKRIRTMSEHSNEVPTTSSTLPPNTQKNPSEKGEDYFYVHKGEDPIDEYYKRNKAYLTVTSMASMYEKSTEMRRLPDYLKQMTSHRRGTMRSQKSASHRSGRSGQSGRSRIGLPQMPSDTHSNKFMRSFYFLASKHRKIGFRHLVMLALVTTYSLLGATIFYHIEGPNEKQTVADTQVQLVDAIKIIAEDLRLVARSTNDSLEKHVKNAYISLLEIEGKYAGSTFYKLESQPEPKYQWTFGSAFFFSFTVFTTIGYGAIAPVTHLGKACTVLYAFVCIPLTMVVIRDFGQFVLVTLTKLYARLLIKLRAARGYLTTESESISLPIKFCSLLSVSYVLAAGVFIYNFDALSGPASEGIDLFNAIYFSFISITTVGFGDVMPSNASFSPVIAIVFFFGLPIMRVVNRVSYVAFENFAFGLLALAEKKIDVGMGGDRKETTVDGIEEGRSQGGRSGRSGRSGRGTRVAAISTDEYSIYGESDEEEEEDARARTELMNNFTIRSLATFMKTRSDVYGGDFGRVNIRKGDL